MRALTFDGKRDVRVDEVPDPSIEEPTDAIVRVTAVLEAIDTVRRGGTISISGAYGGQLDPLPMMQLFDPLGTDDLTTHQLPLEQAPEACEKSQKKEDGAINVVLEA